MILIELFAHVGGVLSFYMDQQAGESRWSTARLRKRFDLRGNAVPVPPPAYGFDSELAF